MNLSDHYLAIASKSLSAVDAEPDSSNQHEIGGLIRAGFGTYLGNPGAETLKFSGSFYYFSEDITEPLVDYGELSWYDSRRKNPARSSEFRLYYTANEVTEVMQANDVLIIGRRPDDGIDLLVAPPHSAAAKLLTLLFDLPSTVGSRFSVTELDQQELDLVKTSILLSLGLEAPEESARNEHHDLVMARFGSTFPSTKEFSIFARETSGDVDPIENPDETLLRWLQQEESLFRALERIIVEERLVEHFESVDDFISFSLSVQNRRKSRAGRAFESHILEILQANGIEFENGSRTENNSKPDFLFPGSDAYHHPDTSHDHLLMLGAKTSCKDRWRQVLSEAAHIKRKHLITIQAAISEPQLQEMEHNNLQLVVPEPLHETYPDTCRDQLMSFKEFIELALEKQSTRGSNRLI